MNKDQEINNTEKENDNIDNNKNISDEKNIDTEKRKEISTEEQIKILEEKVTRSLAEMENQRRRYEKEKEEAFEYGGFSFAREALNLLDNLERSKNSIENDESLKDQKYKNKIIEHIDIIYKDIISIFKKNNIEPINCLNEKLNPNLHQAMMEIEDSNNEPGTIIKEIQKGFLMKDRLLRPSLVGVSKIGLKEDKTEKNIKKEGENKEN